MTKLFEFLTRRADMTLDEFGQYWTERHAALVKEKMIGSQGAFTYVNNVGVSADPAIDSVLYSAPYDGIVGGRDNMTLEEFKQLMGSQHNEEILMDEPNFLGCRPTIMICDETVQTNLDRPHLTKWMTMLIRRHDLSHDEAVNYWVNQHAPRVIKTWGDKLVKFTTNVSKPVPWGPWGEEMTPYDGVAEYWFDLPIEELAREMPKQTKLEQDVKRFARGILSMPVREVIQVDGLGR